MTNNIISSGTVHDIPSALEQALRSDSTALSVWESLTSLARNEWICWVNAPQKPETKKQHVERTISELKEGVRRPCCWYGCIHRTDKVISPSVRNVVLKGK